MVATDHLSSHSADCSRRRAGGEQACRAGNGGAELEEEGTSDQVGGETGDPLCAVMPDRRQMHVLSFRLDPHVGVGRVAPVSRPRFLVDPGSEVPLSDCERVRVMFRTVTCRTVSRPFGGNRSTRWYASKGNKTPDLIKVRCILSDTLLVFIL